MSPHEREALRQQTLLRALWGDARPGVVLGWLRDRDQAALGLRAHQGHAAAQAERALGAAYPVLRALIGAEAFAALALLHWRTRPPSAGDLGVWGDTLAATVAAQPALATEPYLADMARLEWAVHLASRSADAPAPTGLARLGRDDPATLRLHLAPGSALLASAHPVVSIWQAHPAEAGQAAGDADRVAAQAARWDQARAALALGRAETAWVRREGWRVQVDAVSGPEEAAWLAALLRGDDLATARAAAPGLDLATWLHRAVAGGWIAAVEVVGDVAVAGDGGAASP